MSAAGFRWVVALVLGVLGVARAQPASRAEPLPKLAVRSAVLMNAATGEVLYALHPRRPEPPASLTKLMTVDLALRALADGRVHLGDRVRVSDRAYALARDRELSRMFLEPRRPVTVEQLLYGLMVSSADDAATAMAEHLAQTLPSFVDRMNAHARELGLRHTRFGDPAGLSAVGRTDALDMANLARHLLTAYPEILTYSRTRDFTYNAIRQPNYNGLVLRDPRVDGLKTGTLNGEYHLLATATVDGVRLIALVMGAKGHQERERAAETLLDWGFRTVRSAVPEEAPTLLEPELPDGGVTDG